MQRHWRRLVIAALAVASGAGAAGARARGPQSWPVGPRGALPRLTAEEETVRGQRLLAEVAAARAAGAEREILVRSGGWKGPAGVQGRWRARLEHHRGDGTLSGEVTIDGPLGPSRGRVEGRIRGRNVQGTLSDDEGRRIARFSGTASGDSFSGRYEAADGDRGTWSYP